MALSGVLDVWVYQAVNRAKLWRQRGLFGPVQNVTQAAEIRGSSAFLSALHLVSDYISRLMIDRRLASTETGAMTAYASVLGASGLPLGACRLGTLTRPTSP